MRGRLGNCVDVVVAKVEERACGEHGLASDQEIAESAKGVNVASGIDATGRLDCFGRHVEWSASHRAGLHRDSRFVERFDQAEVQHLDDVGIATAAIQHDVGGLDI